MQHYPHTLPDALKYAIEYQTILQKELNKADPDMEVVNAMCARALTSMLRARAAHNLIATANRHTPEATSETMMDHDVPPGFRLIGEAFSRSLNDNLG